MEKEGLKLSLMGRGVSEEALIEVSDFCERNRKFVFPKQQTVENGFELIMSGLGKMISDQELGVIKEITYQELVEKPLMIKYEEVGYDSCQVNRETGKIVSELICLGGVYSEGKLLGLNFKAKDLLSLLNSQLKIDDEQIMMLGLVAEKVGGEQDFLFPGVTASDDEVVELEAMALQALVGKPMVSVRSITGVGGLRFDQEWNYLTDFDSFAELKIEEDKRYYPGLGVYYLLSKLDWQKIPAMTNLLEFNSKAHQELVMVLEKLKGNRIVKENFSLMCSAFIPRYRELKMANEAKLIQTGKLGDFITRVVTNFHSPSHDFGHWYQIGQILSEREEISRDSFWQHVDGIKKWSGGLWSFNSPIHLPWTASLAYLSNGLMGKIKNQKGESAIRFGLGSKNHNRSVEARIYYLNDFELAVRWMVYESSLFESSKIIEDEWLFNNSHEIIRLVQEKGFFQTAIEKIEEHEE